MSASTSHPVRAKQDPAKMSSCSSSPRHGVRYSQPGSHLALEHLPNAITRRPSTRRRRPARQGERPPLHQLLAGVLEQYHVSFGAFLLHGGICVAVLVAIGRGDRHERKDFAIGAVDAKPSDFPAVIDALSECEEERGILGKELLVEVRYFSIL